MATRTVCIVSGEMRHDALPDLRLPGNVGGEHQSHGHGAHLLPHLQLLQRYRSPAAHLCMHSAGHMSSTDERAARRDQHNRMDVPEEANASLG